MNKKWLTTGLLSAAIAGGCSTIPDRDRNPELAREEGYFVSADHATERGGVGNYVTREAWRQKQEDSRAAEKKQLEGPIESSQAAPMPEALPAQSQAEVYFDSDRSRITPEIQATLRELVEGWDATSDARFVIEGYADRPGTEPYNKALSQSRAEAVRDYLIAQGIDPDRIDIRAFGESQAAGPKDESSNTQDRRVRITTREG